MLPIYGDKAEPIVREENNIKKTLTFAIIIIIGGGIILFNVFASGKVLRAQSLGYSDITVSTSSVSGNISSSTSADKFSKFTYRIEDNNLYITVYGGVLSGGWDGGIHIEDDFSELYSIYLADTTTTRLIWQAK